jgi:hypothetical protein
MHAALLLAVSFLAAIAPQPVIKKIGVLGPITGSQGTAGQVEVEVQGPTLALSVNLESSDPRVAAVPQTISVHGVTTFVVKTFPVKSVTDVTITATIGASSKSVALRVLPPTLTVLGCDQPATVDFYKPLKCTAWLDGLAPEDTPIAASANSPEISVPDHVTIPKGATKQAFQVGARRPIAQSVTGRVSIEYLGVTKSYPITVMPVALSTLTVSTAVVNGGAQGRVEAALTAPAPQSGIKVKLSAKVNSPEGAPMPIELHDSVIQLAAGQQTGKSVFSTHYVSVKTSVTITGSTEFSGENEARHVDVSVYPWPINYLHMQPNTFSAVPLGGVKSGVWVIMEGPAGPNTSYDIAYGGDTQITGPAHIQVPYEQKQTHFYVTVSPCSVQPTCHVHVTVGGHQITATVNH